MTKRRLCPPEGRSRHRADDQLKFMCAIPNDMLRVQLAVTERYYVQLMKNPGTINFRSISFGDVCGAFGLGIVLDDPVSKAVVALQPTFRVHANFGF